MVRRFGWLSLEFLEDGFCCYSFASFGLVLATQIALSLGHTKRTISKFTVYEIQELLECNDTEGISAVGCSGIVRNCQGLLPQ